MRALHLNKPIPVDSAEFQDKYVVVGKLGKGAQAGISKVERLSDKEYFAAKIHNITGKTKPEIAKVKEETIFLRTLIHPTIVKLVETFQSPTVYIVIIELCTHDLQKHIIGNNTDRGKLKTNKYKTMKPKLSESEILVLCRQIAVGLEYMHEHRVCHRDIKLENILLCDGIVKITDFGLSTFIKKEYSSYYQMDVDQILTKLVGTPYYMSPEMFEYLGYGFKTDMWSLGVLMFIALHNGVRPFDLEIIYPTTKQDDLFDVVLNSTLEIKDDLEPETKHLLRNLLTKDPKRRPSSEEVLHYKAFNFGHIYYILKDEADASASGYLDLLLAFSNKPTDEYIEFNIIGNKLKSGTLVYLVMPQDLVLVVFQSYEDAEDYVFEQRIYATILVTELP